MHMLSQLLAVSHLAWHLTQYVLSVLCRDDMHWATGMGDCSSYSPGGRNDGELLLELSSLSLLGYVLVCVICTRFLRLLRPR